MRDGIYYSPIVDALYGVMILSSVAAFVFLGGEAWVAAYTVGVGLGFGLHILDKSMKFHYIQQQAKHAVKEELEEQFPEKVESESEDFIREKARDEVRKAEGD